MTVKIKFFSATVKFAAYLNAKNNSARMQSCKRRELCSIS